MLTAIPWALSKTGITIKQTENFVYKITASGQPPIEHVITKQGEPMSAEDVREFIQAFSHIAKSLSDYTDLNYAY